MDFSPRVATKKFAQNLTPPKAWEFKKPDESDDPCVQSIYQFLAVEGLADPRIAGKIKGPPLLVGLIWGDEILPSYRDDYNNPL